MIHHWLLLLFLLHLVNPQSLVMVGGGLNDKDPTIFSKIIQLAGGKNSNIGIITAASDPADAQENGDYYVDLFLKYGASKANWIPIDLDHLSNANDPKIASQIRQNTGVFFGGGDQNRLITCLFQNRDRKETLALETIRKVYQQGGVIGGSSAGTAAQVGRDDLGILPMIAGGESYEALRDGPFIYGQETDSIDDLTYDPDGGLLFFNYGILDTHFSERGRQGRLVRLAYYSHVNFAYGVDEDTALIVTNADSSSASMEVLGTGGVYIFDLQYAFGGSQRDWSIYNVSVTYLTSGDTYDPISRKPQFASWKRSLSGREPFRRANITEDIFSSPNNSNDNGRRNPLEFTKICIRLFESKEDSTYGYTYEYGPSFKVELTKVNWSVGYQGTQKGITVTSFDSLRMDIFPTA